MDTPIIAQYYRETEPKKRKQLLDQAIASGDEASRIKSKIEECSAAIPAADSSSATSEGSDSEE